MPRGSSNFRNVRETTFNGWHDTGPVIHCLFMRERRVSHRPFALQGNRILEDTWPLLAGTLDSQPGSFSSGTSIFSPSLTPVGYLVNLIKNFCHDSSKKDRCLASCEQLTPAHFWLYYPVFYIRNVAILLPLRSDFSFVCSPLRVPALTRRKTCNFAPQRDSCRSRLSEEILRSSPSIFDRCRI